jgi:hypothetical protein
MEALRYDVWIRFVKLTILTNVIEKGDFKTVLEYRYCNSCMKKQVLNFLLMELIE